MARDVYAEVAALGRDLDDVGWGEWRVRLDDAVAAGAVGSEALLALRAELSALLAEESPEVPLRERVRAVLDGVREVLR